MSSPCSNWSNTCSSTAAPLSSARITARGTERPWHCSLGGSASFTAPSSPHLAVGGYRLCSVKCGECRVRERLRERMPPQCDTQGARWPCCHGWHGQHGIVRSLRRSPEREYGVYRTQILCIPKKARITTSWLQRHHPASSSSLDALSSSLA